MIVHEETPQVGGEDQQAPPCCHYWILETASGPISRGECQLCHEVRDFKTSVYDMERESRDNRSRKATEVEEKNPEALEPQVPGELKQEPALDELDTEAPESEEDAAEPETEPEEPELAGVLED